MGKNELRNLKLLYVEDDDNLRQNAMEYFELLFDKTYEAKDGLEGLEVFNEVNPDILITDIKMDKMSGIELSKKVRKIDKKCQILILTAYLDQEYLLEAVELNLVKYLTKPINHEKLSKALNQCYENLNEDHSNIIHISENCTFNIINKILIKDEKIVKLTKTELSLLELFCKNTQRALSFEEIEYGVYYDDMATQNAIRTLVKKLRNKLPKETIQSIYNVGYKIKCLK